MRREKRLLGLRRIIQPVALPQYWAVLGVVPPLAFLLGGLLRALAALAIGFLGGVEITLPVG